MSVFLGLCDFEVLHFRLEVFFSMMPQFLFILPQLDFESLLVWGPYVLFLLSLITKLSIEMRIWLTEYLLTSLLMCFLILVLH